MLRRILHALLSPLGWIALELLEWGLKRWAPEGLILRLELPTVDPGLSGVQNIEACLARPWLRAVLVEQRSLEAWSEASLQQLRGGPMVERRPTAERRPMAEQTPTVVRPQSVVRRLMVGRPTAVAEHPMPAEHPIPVVTLGAT